MKKILLGLILLLSATAYGQVSVGISIGAPPPPRVVVMTASPGADFSWIDGYWYPVNGQYLWHQGYWSRPAYAGARWVGPRHDGHYYHEGYWDGPRGRIGHDHHWDNGRDRDFHHEGGGRGSDHGHGGGHR